jgi:hypothetical protein
MSNRKFIIGLSVLFAIMMIGFSCSLKWLGKSRWQPPKIVSVEGVNELTVWPSIYVRSDLFSSYTFEPVQEGGPIHVLLREGDIVSGESAGFPYRSSDGRYLTIAGDEIQTILNGKTVSLDLNKDEAWHWLENATPKDLDALRLLSINDKPDEQKMALLKRLAEHNPKVGLGLSETVMHQVLSLFDPEWLYYVGPLEEMERAILSSKKQVKTLILFIPEEAVNIKPPIDLTLISQMPRLETLWLYPLHPEFIRPPSKELKNLNRLGLFVSSISGLSGLLMKLPKLEELSLSNEGSGEEEESCDLSQLADFEQLKVLNLAGCKNVKDFAPLKHLKQMKWLSLPSTTTQEQLEGIVRDHPSLVGLDITRTDEITDLTPLESLKNLECLLVSASEAKSEPLFEMKRLKWLAVNDQTKYPQEKGAKEGAKLAEKEDLVEKLQTALPYTAVVRMVVPSCLGSGWILLLLPAIGVSSLVVKSRQAKMRHTAANHGKISGT